MKTYWKFVAAPVALSTSAGCGNGPRLGESGRPMAVSKLAELPPPTGADLVVASSPYRIGPFDKLNVTSSTCRNSAASFRPTPPPPVPSAGRHFDAVWLTPERLAQRSTSVSANTSRTRRSPSTSTKPRARSTRRRPGLAAGQLPGIGNISLMRAVANAKGASELLGLTTLLCFAP